VLIKSLIEAILVYWHLLVIISKGILVRICKKKLTFSRKEVMITLDHIL
jgi:hypothetical protein